MKIAASTEPARFPIPPTTTTMRLPRSSSNARRLISNRGRATSAWSGSRGGQSALPNRRRPRARAGTTDGRPEIDAGLDERHYWEPPTVTWRHLAVVEVDPDTGALT